eukprot:1234859-Prymnesium_polylepis.2
MPAAALRPLPLAAPGSHGIAPDPHAPSSISCSGWPASAGSSTECALPDARAPSPEPRGSRVPTLPSERPPAGARRPRRVRWAPR